MDQISYKTSKIHFNKEILCLELMARTETAQQERSQQYYLCNYHGQKYPWQSTQNTSLTY